jgi:hypothetical protein
VGSPQDIPIVNDCGVFSLIRTGRLPKVMLFGVSCVAVVTLAQSRPAGQRDEPKAQRTAHGSCMGRHAERLSTALVFPPSSNTSPLYRLPIGGCCPVMVGEGRSSMNFLF